VRVIWRYLIHRKRVGPDHQALNHCRKDLLTLSLPDDAFLLSSPQGKQTRKRKKMVGVKGEKTQHYTDPSTPLSSALQIFDPVFLWLSFRLAPDSKPSQARLPTEKTDEMYSL